MSIKVLKNMTPPPKATTAQYPFDSLMSINDMFFVPLADFPGVEIEQLAKRVSGAASMKKKALGDKGEAVEYQTSTVNHEGQLGVGCWRIG